MDNTWCSFFPFWQFFSLLASRVYRSEKRLLQVCYENRACTWLRLDKVATQRRLEGCTEKDNFKFGILTWRPSRQLQYEGKSGKGPKEDCYSSLRHKHALPYLERQSTSTGVMCTRPDDIMYQNYSHPPAKSSTVVSKEPTNLRTYLQNCILRILPPSFPPTLPPTLYHSSHLPVLPGSSSVLFLFSPFSFFTPCPSFLSYYHFFAFCHSLSEARAPLLS